MERDTPAPQGRIYTLVICEKCNYEIVPDDDQQDEIDATDYIVCPRCGAENWAG